MPQLKELQRKAKELGIKRYSSLNKDELILALQGEPVLRKNQRSVGTQTDFPICNECGLQRFVTHLCFKADAEQRKNQVSVGTQTDFPIYNECFKAEQRKNKVINDGDMIVDAETGEVLEYDVDYGFRG